VEEVKGALQESDSRLRDITENSMEIIWEVDAQGRYTYCNQTMEEILGYRPEEVVGKYFYDFYHPEDRERSKNAAMKVFDRKEAFREIPNRNIHRNGQEVWLLTSGIPLLAEGNKLLGYRGAGRDITRRRQAEEALQRLSRQYQQILDAAGEGIICLDLQGKVMFANPMAARLTGYAVEELIGMDLHRHIHHSRPDGSNYPAHECPMYSTINNGAVTCVHDEVLWRKDGSKFFAAYSSTPIYEKDEIRGAVVTIWDITERIKHHEELMQLSNKNQMILNAVGEGIVGLDESGRVTFANPMVAKLTGYSQEELIGHDLHRYIHHSKADGSAYPLEECPMYQALRNGSNCQVLDEVLWRKDGASFDATYFTAPIFEKDKIVGAVFTFWDITERKKAERALRESELAREKEHQKTVNLESLGYLAGGIAHDFNNLLTAILGNISLALAQCDEESQIYQLILKAEQATLKTRGLAQQLLTFAKGGVPVKSLISIPEIIRQSAGFSTVGSSSKCEFDFADKIWAVEADPDQLTQVVQNLVINAVQAMPDGGTIHVGAENIVLTADTELPLSGGRYVKVWVQDQGIGIPQANITKIFDPYFTTKDYGTGLGLTTVYSIIKKHGGHICVEPAPHKGTAFIFYLPASEKESVPLQAAAKEIYKGSGKLLIMDDDDTVLEILGRLTRYLGYECEFAREGTEALHLYAQAMESGQPFDLVIMDLTIPGGMGGKETIRRLREMHPAAKALVSSGYSDDPILSHYKDYGFSGAIKKPYRIGTLSKVLFKCLYK
jgi:PAS domain S-box-containing protein